MVYRLLRRGVPGLVASPFRDQGQTPQYPRLGPAGDEASRPGGAGTGVILGPVTVPFLAKTAKHR
ncbi:MAG: hypothetical protein C4551_00060 [Bacillota bacterium]|nr:MAG: hypothetical protein C4551_00060 [Bacillota bacterium]